MNQSNTGKKYDEGKTQPTILYRDFSKCLAEVTKVLDFGARKYKRDSWRYVPNGKSRYEDALLRHYNSFIVNPYSVDEESGLHHLSHMVCNLLFLHELHLNGEDNDAI